MKALDEFEKRYGKIRHPETGELRPVVVLVEDTDDGFVIQFPNGKGDINSMGYMICTFPFWRDRGTSLP